MGNAKNIFDICTASILLVLTFPLLCVIALFIKREFGTPVIFCQERPGLNAQPFTLYKFRTMKEKNDAKGLPLPDQERLTPFGRFLRSTSMDELPELVNVIKGEMSIVGPRPLLTAYLDRYTPAQARRHNVKPGITGLAQVKGRNTLSWEDRFKLDIWYVDNRSFLLDLKIILMTIRTVLSRQGICEEGEATMTEFNPDKPAKRG